MHQTPCTLWTSGPLLPGQPLRPSSHVASTLQQPPKSSRRLGISRLLPSIVPNLGHHLFLSITDSSVMTRVISSAMRPLRLNGSRALRLGVGAEPAHGLPFEARRAATTSTRSTAAPASKPPPPQSPYKRSATTSTTTSSSSNSSAAKPSASSPAAKNTNTPFAESQTNPVPSAPYSRPQGVNAIPEASTAFSQTANGGAADTAFASPPGGGNGIDWSSSFHGLSTIPFSPEVAAVLMKPIPFEDVEIKPDGIIYLPEIKYRRILNQAFGPGGWGMAPRGELMVGERVVTREYALLVHGR